ncbi:hypothetical protein BDZ97DRAFT_1926009 [Flammula alnicola]|nr:hypothetical protein BDZ97DRAFT_1926005 [Flammula alnicola]KAF8955942.1 hypothetical protein BDZ97DRAFT_1926009 [Flammula alnicola]
MVPRNLTKKDLAAFINRQRDKWPHPTFNPSQTRINDMRTALLDPKNGFTRCDSADPELSRGPQPPPHSVTTSTDGSSVIVIHVLLQDRRRSPIRRTAIDLTTTAASINRFYTVSALEVFTLLQRSISAIEGPAILSCPYYLDPTYSQYIVKWEDGDLQGCQFDPERLHIAADHKMVVYIDSISSNAPRTALQSDSADRISNLDSTGTWLQARIRQLPGYSEFQVAHHRRLQNPQILEGWNFASNIYNLYHKAMCELTQTHISLTLIQSRLGVGETWMADARLGSHLAKLYGPGGTQESKEVVAELTAIRDVPLGRSALLRFLEDWDSTHKVV